MAGLKGKAGIVTGGSSGIGFQIANVLAQAGATVYVISRTGKPKEGVGESAPGVVHLRGDIGNAEAMKTLVAELAAKHNGCLDFLVNNAGVSYKCRAEDFPMEQFDNIMNVNVKYLFQMSVICYPYLKKKCGQGPHHQHHQHERPSGLQRGGAVLCQQGRCAGDDTRSGRGVGAGQHHRQQHRAGLVPQQNERAGSGRSPGAENSEPDAAARLR